MGSVSKLVHKAGSSPILVDGSQLSSCNWTGVVLASDPFRIPTASDIFRPKLVLLNFLLSNVLDFLLSAENVLDFLLSLIAVPLDFLLSELHD